MAPTRSPNSTYRWHNSNTFPHDLRQASPRAREGSDILSEKIGDGAFGVEICRDMGDPELSRRYVAPTRIIAVPAWDFEVDAKWAELIATVRGVETGTSVVRASRDGMVSVTYSFGRVLARAHTGRRFPAVAMAAVPATPRWTFYKRFGIGPS